MTELDLIITFTVAVALYGVGTAMWVFNGEITSWIFALTRGVIKVPTIVVLTASIVLPLVVFILLVFPLEWIHLW